MQLESITCNHCGAPLDVPDAANFVKCNHCDSRLAIKRTQSTTYTEELAGLDSMNACDSTLALARKRSVDATRDDAVNGCGKRRALGLAAN
jgi:DNA-directed RNA polymerase subunit RPC12/RpoP